MIRYSLIASVLATAAWAQEPPEPTTTRNAAAEAELATAAAVRPQRLSELLDLTVVSPTGEAMAVVTDVVIDPASLSMFLIAEDRNSERLHAIPYQAVRVDTASAQAKLPLTMTTLRTAPSFTADAWPTFAAAEYQRRLAQAYGVTLSTRSATSAALRPRRPNRTVLPEEERRADGDPLPGGTGAGVRGRGSGTATGSAAIGGAGAAGAPGGAVTGARKPSPTGPKPPPNPNQ